MKKKKKKKRENKYRDLFPQPQERKPMKLIKSGEKFYQTVEIGDWLGVLPVDVDVKSIDKGLSHRRTRGKKITRDLARQILAFLKWSYDDTKGETVVTLFYHEELGWEALVLPQKAKQGLTVEVYEDHPNRIPTYERLGGGDPDKRAGFVMRGTWHHHCNIAASMSGGDHADEKTKEGIHITTGDLGEKSFSIHARTSFRKEVLPAHLVDWFELDSEVAAATPKEFHEGILRFQLCQNPEDASFPEWWKDNVIKHVEPPRSVTTYPCQGYSGHPGVVTNEEYWRSRTPGHYQRTVNPSHSSGYGHFGHHRYDFEQFTRSLVEIGNQYGYNLESFKKECKELEVEPICSIIKAMVKYEQDFFDLDNAIDEIEMETIRRETQGEKELEQQLAKEEAMEAKKKAEEKSADDKEAADAQAGRSVPRPIRYWDSKANCYKELPPGKTTADDSDGFAGAIIY